MRLRLGLIFFLAFSGLVQPASTLKIELPPGIPRELWEYFIPKDNPMTAEKIELGRQLFFDKRLSADGTISCASCHDPSKAFADGKAVAEGISGRRGSRNTPTLLNAMFNSSLFWDGRAESLEEQARLPLVDPNEMGNRSYQEVVDRLRGLPEYAAQFRRVFGGPVTIENISKAIAAYERTLVSGDSPFDRFMAGDASAMSESAQRGLALFRGKARCSICHTINQAFPFFTDQTYRNTGVAAFAPEFESLARRAAQMARSPSADQLRELSSLRAASSLGRFLISGNQLDIGAFRTPSLRNVELTAPYFHDGSARTLDEVLEFYAQGGRPNLNRDWELIPINLTESERADLMEFLKSLTGARMAEIRLGP
jgi:cytochrome c peroxidase